MAEESNIILQYVRSIDERTARMETTISTAMQLHQQSDDKTHSDMQKDIDSLKSSRIAARALIIGAGAAGTGAGAKLGLVAKITSLFGGA